MLLSRPEFAQCGEIEYMAKSIISCILDIGGRKKCSQQQVAG